jgi:tetratricopeptide (TPR) repeat protein
MYSNTQIEIALDEFFDNTIDRNRLNEILNNNGINDSNEAINIHQIAVTAVTQYNLMKQVQQVHAQFAGKVLQTAKDKQEPKVIRMQARAFVMRIAAGLLLLLTGYTTVQYFNSTGSAFYKSMHNTYHASENRSIITEPSSELVEAYKKGNYASVINAFTQLRNPGNREMFFAGNSYLETNNALKAITLFEKVLDRNKTTGELLYQDEAEYYLAMAHLKNNDTDKALPLLYKIADETGHTYHHKIDKFVLFKMKWLGHK